MKTFQQFLNEKMYGLNSRGSNSSARLMSKSVKPAKPILSLSSPLHLNKKKK
jgi:hypothetical protein